MTFPKHPFHRQWLAVTLGSACLVTVVDALLLQRRRSYFTGGFLAVDYLQGPVEIATFLVVSVIADAAVIGVIAAAALWISGRVGLRARAGALAATLAGAGSLLLASAVSYRIATYLGDIFDLSIAFDLAGGSLAEMLAVTSSHLLLPAAAIGAAVATAGGLVWAANRYATDDRPLRCGPRVLLAPVLTGVAGLVVVTAVTASSDTYENGLLRKASGKTLTFAANLLSDVDRDGFGVAGRLRDPDLFNRAVYPYAIDIPGNLIDEDGVGGDLPAGTPPYEEPPLPTGPWARRPDVVLIVLESFRADMLGLRFDGHQVTPAIDAVAARGISARHAYSHNGYTAPSRYHLFSGSLAGVGDGRTLVDDFNAQGYLTAYISGQDESFHAPEYGVGFERATVRYDARQDRDRRYSTFTTAGSLAVPLGVVLERVEAFLGEKGRTPDPLFLYVNFHDTHFPYTYPQIETLVSPVRLARAAIAPEARDALWATYVNTAANVDRAVGEVLARVERARGVAPAVIVTADHGESLFDEGFLGHGYALNEVQTRVPLVAAGLPLVVDEPFGQRDLRGELDAALRVDPSEASVPRLGAPAGREVFQYLGTLRSPGQIAFLGDKGRFVYDFRNNRAKAADGDWRAPSALGPTEQEDLLRLIRTWERMKLARQSRPDTGDGR